MPWQLLAEGAGALVLCDANHRRRRPPGFEGRLDTLLTREVKLFAFTHISNSLGTVNPVAGLCERARKLGVTTLIDAAQAPGTVSSTSRRWALAFSWLFPLTKSARADGHQFHPEVREEILNSMPPYQGGGEMILNVDFQRSTFKPAPHRFEAGTPDMSGVIGLHAALDYLDAIGRENIFHHDQELAAHAYEQLSRMNGIRLFGPKTGRAGLVSFLLNDVHAHDVVTVADQWGVALRGGHHCNQPLMKKLGVPSTARASFYFYNTRAEVDRFIEVVKEIQKYFA